MVGGFDLRQVACAGEEEKAGGGDGGGVGAAVFGVGDAVAAGGVGERAARGRDVLADDADGFLYSPVRGFRAGVGVDRAAAQLLGAADIRAIGREHGADRQGQRVAGVLGGTRQVRAASPGSSRG